MLDLLAQEEHLQLVDFHGALTNHEDLLPDGLHPNNAGAEIMALTAYQALMSKTFEGAVPVAPEESRGGKDEAAPNRREQKNKRREGATKPANE
jgi:hypothetical protein